MIRRALLLVALLTAPLLACAIALPPGYWANMAGEEALVVWDPATHTEQFIRRATIRATAKSVGFLVPTPTRPDLEEVHDPELFSRLLAAIQPGHTWFHFGGLWIRSQGMRSGGGAEVHLMEVARVGPFQASVLQASDPGGLLPWLKQRGFQADSPLEDWVKPYLRRGWYLTAFQLVGEKQIGTGTVRMTFHTDRPFFPYSEPARGERWRGPDEGLRLHLIGPTRMRGVSERGDPWRADLLYAAVSPAGVVADLPAGDRLTSYYTFDPRPSTGDLFFEPDPDQSQFVHKPVPGGVLIPVDVLLLVGVAVLLVWVVRRLP